MAAKMLYAYYDHSCDSRSLFADLAIAKDPQFEQHLNKYAAIYLDMTNFVSQFKSDPNIPVGSGCLQGVRGCLYDRHSSCEEV